MVTVTTLFEAELEALTSPPKPHSLSFPNSYLRLIRLPFGFNFGQFGTKCSQPNCKLFKVIRQSNFSGPWTQYGHSAAISYQVDFTILPTWFYHEILQQTIQISPDKLTRNGPDD